MNYFDSSLNELDIVRYHYQRENLRQFRIFVCFISGIIYQCRVCGITFTQQKFLSKHSKKCKDGEFRCTKCFKGFDSKHNLKTHCSRIHKEHRFECQACGKVFNRKFNPNTHMLVIIWTMRVTMRKKIQE